MPETGQEERAADWGRRTPTDFSSLLVELARVIRAMGFYEEGDPARSDAIDRSFLALRGDLERSGVLELWIDESTFRASGVSEPIPHGRLADVAETLQNHEIEHVRFTPELTRDSLGAFVELLGRDPRALEQSGGFARGLAARSAAGLLLGDGAGIEAVGTHPELGSSLATPGASLGSALLARSNQLVVKERTRAEKLAIEDEPLHAVASDERGERLLFRLIELDRCSDDDAYDFLSRRIVDWARELFDAGLPDECYRAILVLSDHAQGEGGRSGLQARVAQTRCRDLASGPQLGDVIDRACSDNTRVGVRATRVMLQLGEPAITPLFERLADEQSADRAAQLTAVLITLGEAALPQLTRAMKGPSDARAQLAIRLAGELQSTAVVPTLVEVLNGDRPALRRDAARSLAEIGGQAATGALSEALASSEPQLPETAALCLGAIGDPRCVPAMLNALETALRQADATRAREIIRALGLLGSERAVPKLVALLERRSMLRRRALRELKLAALATLEKLPGREAQRALRRAATHERDPQLRGRAEQLLRGERSGGSPDERAVRGESLQ